MRLELVPLPTVDVDRRKAFYIDKVGFSLDHDVEPGNGMRVVQLTPPGSACSILIGVGVSDPCRAELTGRGVELSDVQDMGRVRYAHFNDPDGNSWALQEIPHRP